MHKGNAVAWQREGSVPLAQAHGGQAMETRTVAAGGMPYEEVAPANQARYNCKALKKSGEQCGSWTVSDTPYCQGHLNQLEKLNKKIDTCKDEAERLLLEDERMRKWL